MEPPSAPHPCDADLLRAAGRGDGNAFAALLDRHGDALYQVALSYTRKRADADDLLQETLLAAFRGAGGFEGRASVRTWLLRILAREAARAWRRGKRRGEMTSLDGSAAAAAAEVAIRSPATAVERRLDIAAVLAELSDMHREVLVMREIWDLTYDQIAAALHVPRGTVESRLSRARQQFRRRFDDES